MSDTPHSDNELTVNELIEKLQGIKDKSLPVYTEGCDCFGNECNVVVEKNRVYISRDDRDAPTEQKGKK